MAEEAVSSESFVWRHWSRFGGTMTLSVAGLAAAPLARRQRVSSALLRVAPSGPLARAIGHDVSLCVIYARGKTSGGKNWRLEKEAPVVIVIVIINGRAGGLHAPPEPTESTPSEP